MSVTGGVTMLELPLILLMALLGVCIRSLQKPVHGRVGLFRLHCLVDVLVSMEIVPLESTSPVPVMLDGLEHTVLWPAVAPSVFTAPVLEEHVSALLDGLELHVTKMPAPLSLVSTEVSV